ncbi:MAG: formylglycine-generating enzyme family protein [Lentisphaerae bacterium]|nr:formylglycine-generating enzyme family protein [Lentisphaerota bacterium]
MMRTRLTMSAFIGSLAVASLAAPPIEPLPGRVTSSGITESRLFRDHPLRLRTSCGTIHLALHDVHAITQRKMEPRARLETTRGDVWLIELRQLDGQLAAMPGPGANPREDTPLAFDRIELNPLAGEAPAPGQIQVSFVDEQRVVVIPDDWTFDIPDGHAQWSLPVGALLSMSRTEGTGSTSKSSPHWSVLFPSGVKADLPEPPRNRLLAATDRYGNALDIPLQDVSRLETAARSGTVSQPSPAAPQADGAADRVRSTDMPFAVIRISGLLGDVPLPAAMLNAVAPLSDGNVQATTVYGEHFIGTATPAELTLRHIPGRGQVTVTLARDNLAWEPARALPLPPGTQVWQLSDGNIVAASLADTDLTLKVSGTDAPVRIPSSNLVSVVNHGSMLTVTDDREALHYGRPARTSVALILLTTGMRCEIPWSQVIGVSRDFSPAASSALPGPGTDELRDGMLRIAGGTYLMGRTRGDGQPDELPPHALTLPDFFMDPYEITRAQFAEFVAATRYRTDAEAAGAATTWRDPGFLQRSDEPVVWVSWRDAAQFCNWRSTTAHLTPCYTFGRRPDDVTTLPDRNGYRLPTEAEWEYAARAGGGDVLYPWGDESSANALPKLANLSAAAGTPADDWLWTNPVRAFPPNALGLFGMAGNVWEWCEDWYFDRAYESVHRQRPGDPSVRTGDVAGLARRVMRGGSFDSEIELLRCASRANGLPQASASRVGFRCVRSASPAGEAAP